jgi:hypothetical protein
VISPPGLGEMVAAIEIARAQMRRQSAEQSLEARDQA